MVNVAIPSKDNISKKEYEKLPRTEKRGRKDVGDEGSSVFACGKWNT